MIKRLCVFCGALPGREPEYRSAARELGCFLADKQIELVYGGGKIGLMGEIADAVLGNGGKAIGVIPRALLEKELGHGGITELHVVETMHQRKALMSELSDAFVAMPGGFGTLEELFEVITWLQLGAHKKPCSLLNVEGYFDNLLSFLDHVRDTGFLTPEDRKTLIVGTSPEDLLVRLESFEPTIATKWMALEQT